jgi:tRNA-dihydrouridine synthase
MVLDHYGSALAFYGEGLGARVIRKHLGWYMDDTRPPAELRRAILTADSPVQVLRLLPQALAGGNGSAPAREVA